MNLIKSIVLNRNSILVFAVIVGLILGDYASLIKDYNIYILGVTMTFSMTGLNLLLLKNFKTVSKAFLMGIVLNYFLFGLVLLPIAWLLMPTKELFYGFVVIVAAPPGVAIIPFSYILKGKVDYAIVAVTGAFVSSIFIAPLLVKIFANSEGVKPYNLFITMVQLVVIPLIIGQLLRHKSVFPLVEIVRGKIVDWGFALLIFVAVGVNRQVFFSNPTVLMLVVITIVIITFGLGTVYELIAKRMGVPSPIRITQNMLSTIKSSGFSVFTALTLFGQEAAIPSAVLAIMVLIYLIYLSLKSNKETKSIPS
jgi:bile acid:Na+ symporter, BASS family